MKVLTILDLRQRNYTVNIKEMETHLMNGNFSIHITDFTSRQPQTISSNLNYSHNL